MNGTVFRNAMTKFWRSFQYLWYSFLFIKRRDNFGHSSFFSFLVKNGTDIILKNETYAAVLTKPSRVLRLLPVAIYLSLLR